MVGDGDEGDEEELPAKVCENQESWVSNNKH